ncbi:MAG: ABC transporter substrate-binding protein [Pseudohongiellaceae bacterium]|nr:ABC transporter substrate-binding protein [Pseudohongiellaceae bacterium]
MNKVLIALSMLMVAASSMAAEPRGAVDSTRESVNELLATVQELKPYYQSDKERYFAGIEKSLSSFVDFDAVATGVMARYSEQASPEQISRFGEKLRSTLTRFYGAALTGYDGQELEFMPGNVDESDGTAVVRMRIATNNNTVDLQYALFLNEAGDWKLRNLLLSGINLRRQYYTQFSALMNRYGNDIDQVIDNWQ